MQYRSRQVVFRDVLTLIYIVVLLVPGLLCVRATGRPLDARGLLLALSAGWVLAVAGAVLVRMAGLTAAGFAGLLVLELALLGGLAWRRGRPAIHWTAPALAGGLLSLAAAGLWLIWTGPYLELPSDAWWHLEVLQRQADWLASPTALGARLPLGLNGPAYLVPALTLQLAGLAPADALAELSLVRSLMMVAGVYLFALVLAEQAGLPPARSAGMAATAVVLFVLGTGVHVFSYFRYYVFAPGYHNMLAFFGAALLLIEILQERRPAAGRLLALVAIAAALALAHVQEMAFLAVLGLLLAGISVFRGRAGTGAPQAAYWLFFGGLGAYIGIHLYSYIYVRPHNALEHGYLVALGDSGMFAADPGGRFLDVVGLWGLAVCALSLLQWRRLAEQWFLAAALVTPLVTLFNPVFVDLFLRFSYPEVLWRFALMMPLGFAAALLVWLPQPARWQRWAVPALLLGLLWPLDPAPVRGWDTRLYSVLPVSPANDHRQWADLYAYLRGQGKQNILTDPVTGYAVPGLTGRKYRGGYKYWPMPEYLLNRRQLQVADFDKYRGWTLVVNLRDGEPSRNGRLSRHWPEDVLRVSQYYSPQFRKLLRSRPDRFRVLWGRDRIRVFEIS